MIINTVNALPLGPLFKNILGSSAEQAVKKSDDILNKTPPSSAGGKGDNSINYLTGAKESLEQTGKEDSESEEPDLSAQLEALDAINKGNYEKVIKKWRPIAEQGNPFAQVLIGGLYGEGKGVQQSYANDRPFNDSNYT